MLQFQLGIYLLPQLDVVNSLWLLIWISKHVWFSVYQVHPRNPEYLSVLPTLWAHVWPSITSREKVNRGGEASGFVMWNGSLSGRDRCPSESAWGLKRALKSVLFTGAVPRHWRTTGGNKGLWEKYASGSPFCYWEQQVYLLQTLSTQADTYSSTLSFRS